MAATPKSGTFIFQGASGRRYSKEIYVSDVAGALITFDSGGGAGASSPDNWIAPETVMLIDYSQVTGTADTTKMQVISNGVQTGDILRYETFLSSLNNRPSPRIPFRAGSRIAAIQLA